MTHKKRSITAEDLYQFKLVTHCHLSPDGRHIVYAVERAVAKTEKKYSNLWVVATDGESEPRQFSYGDQVDSTPRWSADGRAIAFLSNRGDEKQPQLYILPFHGGEARPLTEMKGTFGSFEWSPDGRRLVCMFRKKDSDAVEREEDEQKKKLGIVARHITRVTYRFDGTGYLPKEQWHIWTIDVGSGQTEQLTSGDDYAEVEPHWSPDGREILFFSNRSEDPDLTPELVDLFVIPAGGAVEEEWRCIKTPVGSKTLASYSPDGRSIAYLGREGRGNWWQNTNVWLVPADGSGPAQNLTGRYDIEVGSGTLSDSGDQALWAPVWCRGRLYFQVTRHGSTLLQSIGCDGEDLRVVRPAGGVIASFSFDDEQRQMGYIRTGPTEPGQVWVSEVGGDGAVGDGRQLTGLNEDWLPEVDLGEIEEIWYQGSEGHALQGWILKPPDFDPHKKYASILEIHGGPWLQYGHAFMHEFYFLAGQGGYVVHFTNPRGGQGYGEMHSKAIHRHWGEADYADVMTWTDLVARQPYIDPERMGVTGGSYGGYMTTWIIGHSRRFKAAVGQRVVSNAISFWGSSDVGLLFEDPWSGKPPWEDLETYWTQSPMKYIANVQTPTLLIHSEQDYRCDLEQGVQVFRALKRLGVDTELVLFPDESHGLSRGGRTDRRIVRLNHILRWFDKYLA